MKKQIAPNAVLTLLISLCTLTSAFAQEAVINKIFNSGYKSTGDSDVVEILVVKHKLNMKGMIIRDYAENEGSFVKNARQETGGFIFAEREEWSGLQAGTLLVLSITTEGFQKFGDTVIRCGMRNSQYFRRLSPQTDFNIGQEDVIELKSGDSAHTSIHALAVGFTNKKRPKFPKLLFTPEKTVGKKSQIIVDKTERTTPFCIATNSNASIKDFSGNQAQTLAEATFGSANTASNQAFIDKLRKKWRKKI